MDIRVHMQTPYMYAEANKTTKIVKLKWLAYRMKFCRSASWDILELRLESFIKREQSWTQVPWIRPCLFSSVRESWGPAWCDPWLNRPKRIRGGGQICARSSVVSPLVKTVSSGLSSSGWRLDLPILFKFLRYATTRALVRLLTNFTIMGLGFTTAVVSPPLDCKRAASILSTQCDTSISSCVRGGFSCMAWLQRFSSFWSVVPGVSSGMPNTRIDAQRLCCSRSSAHAFKSRRRPSSFRLIEVCSDPTLRWKSFTVSWRTWVTGSNFSTGNYGKYFPRPPSRYSDCGRDYVIDRT